MRTALIAWDYPPAPSGLSVAAREIAESLAAAGGAVTVFTMDREGTSEAGGVSIVGCAPKGALATLRLYGGIGHLAAPLAFRRAVLAAHARRPFAVVEATNWYAPAALLGRRSPIPLVTRNSTPAAFSRTPAGSLRDRIDNRTADRLERRQARDSAGLISNTADHGERMEREYGLAGKAQPHAVIGLSLSPETLARAGGALAPRAVAGEPFRLLFVGRAEHRKGFDAILAAAGQLAADPALPPFVIRLAGIDAAALAAAPAAAAAVLRPLGRLAEEALHHEYAAAHAVLAPSRYESFGLVYQEAMAYGRPVIASREDASARVFVGDTGAGMMAERTSGEALAAAIHPVLGDAALRERLRERALAAAGRFTRHSLADETLALYERAVSRFQER